MLDVLFAIGRALCVLVLFFGAYLAIAEAIDTTNRSDDDGQ